MRNPGRHPDDRPWFGIHRLPLDCDSSVSFHHEKEFVALRMDMWCDALSRFEAQQSYQSFCILDWDSAILLGREGRQRTNFQQIYNARQMPSSPPRIILSDQECKRRARITGAKLRPTGEESNLCLRDESEANFCNNNRFDDSNIQMMMKRRISLDLLCLFCPATLRRGLERCHLLPTIIVWP
jgi:hypothetical protein